MDAAAPMAEVEAAVVRGEVEPYFFAHKAYRLLLTRFRLGLYERGRAGRREFARGRTPWSACWNGWIIPPATGNYGFSLAATEPGSGTGRRRR